MNSPKKGDKIAVWFSNGAASAVALKQTVLKYGDICQIRAVNNPIREEHADNLRFANDVAHWCNIEIEHFTNPRWPGASAVEVWGERKGMSFPMGAPCTTHLKKEARQIWEKTNPVDWHVFGFTSDEKKRHDRFILSERENVIPVLIDAGISKDDCYDIISAAGIRLPEVYSLGYPNANCLGCVKATSPTYWNHVRRVHPDIFKERMEQSKGLNARLVRYQGRRIFLEDLPAEAVGRPMKVMRIECGIICEERPVETDTVWENLLERYLHDEW